MATKFALRDIRWREGLWRVWIVFTCLWVILAYFVVTPLERLRHRSDPIRLSVGMAYEPVEFPAGTDRETMRRAIVALVKQEEAHANSAPKSDDDKIFDGVLRRDPEKEADEALEFYTPPETTVHIIAEFLMVAAIPPILLLGFAYLIGWIGKGFAPSKP